MPVSSSTSRSAASSGSSLSSTCPPGGSHLPSLRWKCSSTQPSCTTNTATVKWRRTSPGVTGGWAGIDPERASLSCGGVALDNALVVALNRAAHSTRTGRRLVSGAATTLAGVEVFLMCWLALVGGRRAALRMLGAVCLVHVASDVLGAVWPRRRPFAQLSNVQALAHHDEKR